MKSIIKKFIIQLNQNKSGEFFVSKIPMVYFLLLIITGVLVLFGIKTNPIAVPLPAAQGKILLLSFLILLTGAAVIAAMYIKLKKDGMKNIDYAEADKAALASSEKKYKSVINRSPVAIVQFDQHLIITDNNPQLGNLIPNHKSSFIGRSLEDFFSNELINAFRKTIEGKEVSEDGFIKSTDHKPKIFISVNTASVQDSDSGLCSGIAIIHDVTDKKLFETDLKKSNRFYKLSGNSNRILLKSETDSELIDKMCKLLTDEAGYKAVAVAYLQDRKDFTFRRVYSRGDKQIDKLFTDNFRNARKIESPIVTSVKLNKPFSFYPNELFENHNAEYGTNKTIVFPLNGQGVAFGVLIIQTDISLKVDSDEFNFVSEIVSDLAFGLSRFEVESSNKKIKSALFESEEKFKRLIDSTDDVIFTLDTDFKVQGLYGRWIDSYFHKPSEIIGKDALDVFGSDDGQIHIDNIKMAIKGETVTYDWNMQFENKKFYFATTLSALYDENGNISGVVGISKDITKIKESTIALEREHQRNKIYLDSTTDGFVLYNTEGEILECNKSFLNLTGLDKADALNQNFNSFIVQHQPSDPAGSDIEFKEDKSFRTETKLRNLQGFTIPVEIITNKLKINNEDVCISSIRDLSARKKSEEKLNLLSKAIENSPAGVVITDANANIEYVNKRYEEITGYSAAELIGKNPRVLKSGSTPITVYEELWADITSGKEWDGELLNKRKKGELYWEHALISPMDDEKGITMHYVAIKEDISQKKEMERMLIEAKEKAEEMNRLKSNFLANMSHELRTPMIGILGYSELLQNELKENPELFELASVINRGGNRLMETLNQILDLSRIESGNHETCIELVNIKALIDESVRLFEEMAKQKNLFLGSKFLFEDIKIQTDPRLLTLAINNLLNNAIKFTKSGSVTIGVKPDKMHDKDYIIIRVNDTGIGIPRDKQKIIFDEFRQASEGYSRSFEGTGLGLSLTKKAIEILGGIITVDSQPGVGSTFTIKLPAEVN